MKSKMKFPILYINILIALISQSANSQTWQWAERAGGTGNDFANAMDVDSLGNAYIAGKFFDSAVFGSTTLSTPGIWSVYIAKYNSAGNLIWAVIAASDSAISVSGINVDVFGNIYLCGQYFNTAVFGTSNPVNLTTSGDYDVFIAKYNNTGNLIWAESTGGPGIDYTGGVSTDASGNVYLAGDVHISSFPYSGSKLFISKYDSLGNISWNKTEINFGTNHISNGIKTDASGNSYLTGDFFNTINFDSSTVIDAGNIESNAFILKFDSSGNIVWGQKAGAPSGYCGSSEIDIDASGNSYITGYYHGVINFDSLSLGGTTGTGYNVFAAKCNAGGNFEWVNRSTGYGSSKCISIDNTGNVFISGTFVQPISFDSISLNTSGNNDIFISELNSSGNFIWAESCGGPGNDYSTSLNVKTSGIYLSGFYSDTIHFGTSMTLPSDSLFSDIFIAKLNTTAGIEGGLDNTLSISCYPNPVENEIRFTGITGNENYLIYDEIGNALKSGFFQGTNSLLVNDLKSGIYLIRIISNKNSYEYKPVRFIKITAASMR